jgi:hypothetical protein
VHRDLKPENVFVEAVRDGHEVVKLLDLGLAKVVAAEGATETGMALGTPHYMAPEQFMDSRDATPAADVWSAGVLLHEILTGGLRPFDGPTPQAILVQACTTAAAPLRSHAPALPEALAVLVDACLARDPAARPADGRVLAGRLRAARTPAAPFETERVRIPRFEAVSDTLAQPTPSGVRPLAPERPSWRLEAGDGWSLPVPPAWRRRGSLVPHMALLVEGPDGAPPPRLVLKVEPWEGSSEAFVRLGLENWAAVGRVLLTRDATLGGLPCLEVEGLLAAGVRARRAVRRALVRDGRGYVLGVEASPDAWALRVAGFQAILDGFAFG